MWKLSVPSHQQATLRNSYNNWIQKAKKEADILIKIFNEGGKLEFDTNLYGNKEAVRPFLESLFNYKCAYCEWKPTRTDWDVEHFRPKARVSDDPSHPGYYWLAYKWTNLYMSCKYCNQARKESPKGKALGKSDQFPLEVGSLRATGPNMDETLEKCLLIDPCHDNPEDYITFGLDGKPRAIDSNPRGLKSIEVYHLNWSPANNERREKIAHFIFNWNKLQDEIESFRRYPDDPRFLQNIRDYLSLLDSLASDESSYAQVIRCVRKRPWAYELKELDLTDIATRL